MKIVYQAQSYTPSAVTGRYCRVSGQKGNYTFRVFEAMSGNTKHFLGKPGMGPTLREYDTDGAELPAELRERCIRSKCTEKWD